MDIRSFERIPQKTAQAKKIKRNKKKTKEDESQDETLPWENGEERKESQGCFESSEIEVRGYQLNDALQWYWEYYWL
jgi:hypothetical protein